MISDRTKAWLKILGKCRKEHSFYVIDRGQANCKFTGDFCTDLNCPKLEEMK